MPAAGLTAEILIGPIAAATIVNLIWFAVIWRGHQHERRQGKMPWQFDLALGAYIAANAAVAYFRFRHPVVTGLDLFAIAFVSEAAGIVITYGLVHAFVLTRGLPWRDRAFPIAGSLFLAAVMIAATLKV